MYNTGFQPHVIIITDNNSQNSDFLAIRFIKLLDTIECKVLEILKRYIPDTKYNSQKIRFYIKVYKYAKSINANCICLRHLHQIKIIIIPLILNIYSVYNPTTVLL